MNKKALMEKRDEHMNRMNELTSAAETENRALSDEEIAEFDNCENEIRAIDATIERMDRNSGIERRPASGTPEERAAAEEREFENYVFGRISEMRAGEQNVSMANNSGAIIPTSISNRIITAVKDRCPILAGATMYAVAGNLKVPVWGKANNHDIAVGYQTELTDITADAGKFTSVDLGGYLAGALTLIGRSVETNAAFSVTEFIINQMAEEIANWIEGQLLTGTGSSAAQGALMSTNQMTAAAAAAITADELISLQASVKQAHQANACWTMAPATFTAVKKLKDNQGRYLLQDDFSGEFPYRLLGKPVYLSDNMPAMTTGNKAVLYGDYSGLSVNFRENISIEVLREKYATAHAIGVLSFFEFDAKVTDNQKLAVLKMA